MLKVGITGGIGTGKSFVCSIIEQLGFPVFYSDNFSKELLESDESIKTFIIQNFGANLFADGVLDRKLLASFLFNDTDKLASFNQLIHPKVRSGFETWTRNQTSKVVFNEAAILFETGSYKNMDFNILITSPYDLRIKRLIKRDLCSIEQVEERIKNQWTDDQKIPLASFVIVNDEKLSLIDQIDDVIKSLISER